MSVWKIEGRKKGPHYVYYTVKAYQKLRDHVGDARERKDALELLEWSLGRTGTHYRFLSQRPQNPVNPEIQTGSGYLIGRVKGRAEGTYVDSREPLLSGDVLRVGYEDEAWHTIIRVGRYVPKKGRLFIRQRGGGKFAGGTPVFLTDRREKELQGMIDALEASLTEVGPVTPSPRYRVRLPRSSLKTAPPWISGSIGRRGGGRTGAGPASGFRTMR